ncbi:MAG: ABC transporter ATP-binding protein [Thermoanaerobaculia bacterium]
MSDSTAIAVENLTKRFGDLDAVDGVSFRVRRGEIFGLLGPNGAGKTTTIQLLLGLTTPTAGRIRILGLELPRHRRAILQRVNFSSTYVSLPGNLTVWENLNVFARLYGVRRPAARIARLLELFEVPALRGKVTGSLSSGQLTRLNLCKAFINDPEVLFLDEPTASLDPDIADKVRATLRQIQRERGVTMVYTSHNMQEVERMCDRIAFLSRGRLVAEGTPRQLLESAGRGSLEELFIAIARQGQPPRGSAEEPA